MKVLHISATDIKGGANRAAHRIYMAQKNNGIDAHFWAANKFSDDPAILTDEHAVSAWLRRAFTSAEHRLMKRVKGPTQEAYNACLWRSLRPHSKLIEAFDVINLHFIPGTGLTLSAIRHIRKPVAWTAHDMWPCLAGLHYDTDPADDRPIIRSWTDRFLWRAKHKLNKKNKIAYIAPSRWMERCIATSGITKDAPCRHIPYPIDTTIFKPLDKNACRELFNLPTGKKIILFGAEKAMVHRSRKGGDLLVEVLAKTGIKTKERAILVSFGAKNLPFFKSEGIAHHPLGNLQDDRLLAAAYAAADVFVCPSRQDNLPNTVIESLACGTPVLGFDIGGMPDMVVSGENGMLCTPFDTLGMSNKLEDMLARNWDSQTIAIDAAKRFSPAMVSRQYADFYETLIGR